jgi:hypothetical protein
MRLDVVCSDEDQRDLLTPSMEVESVDPASGVWMRCCPQCNVVLWKSTPCATVRCVCGWEWQS